MEGISQGLLSYWRAEAAGFEPDELAKKIRQDQSEIERNDPRCPTPYKFAVARLPILLAEQALRSNDVPTEAA